MPSLGKLCSQAFYPAEHSSVDTIPACDRQTDRHICRNRYRAVASLRLGRRAVKLDLPADRSSSCLPVSIQVGDVTWRIDVMTKYPLRSGVAWGRLINVLQPASDHCITVVDADRRLYKHRSTSTEYKPAYVARVRTAGAV